jgi:hypothetical protein
MEAFDDLDAPVERVASCPPVPCTPGGMAVYPRETA